MGIKKIKSFGRKCVTEIGFIPHYVFDHFYKSPIPLPPVRLRYRIGGDTNPALFAQKGFQLATDIQNGIAKSGCKSANLRNVLDFGCGCGRVLGFLKKSMPNASFSGTDIDTSLVCWMKTNYPDVRVAQNSFHPPSVYNDEEFDLIYAISVFTHLDEKLQDEWLTELSRISRPGAVLLLSIHGETCASEKQLPELQRNGFLYVVHNTGFLKLDGLPDFYQTAWHIPSYIHNHWGKWFDVLELIPKGVNNHQDLVVLRRR